MIRENGTYRSDLVICWNCSDIGHVYQDCSPPLLRDFCFGCGTPGVRKPDCLKCQKKKFAGNLMSGASYQREQQRPLQTRFNNLPQNQMGPKQSMNLPPHQK